MICQLNGILAACAAVSGFEAMVGAAMSAAVGYAALVPVVGHYAFVEFSSTPFPERNPFDSDRFLLRVEKQGE